LLFEIAQSPGATYTYYLKRSTQADKYIEEKKIIAAIYRQNKGRYGHRRITTELRKRGFMRNHKTVQRLMKALGACLPYADEEAPLLQGGSGQNRSKSAEAWLRSGKANRKWTAGVTVFKLFGQKRCLSPIPDLCSRNIVGSIPAIIIAAGQSLGACRLRLTGGKPLKNA
jgi:putative transposase